MAIATPGIVNSAAFIQPIANSPDAPNPADSYQRQQLNQQRIAQERLNTLDAREKSRLTSTVYGAAQLQPYLDSGDTQGAQNFLTQRREQLAKRIGMGENIDTRETDDALRLLQDNPEQLKQHVKAIVGFGQQSGILKTPDSAASGGATGALVNRLMAENPGLSYSDALGQVQTGYRQGFVFQGGQATPIPGLENTKTRLSAADELGKQKVQLAYEPTIEGNKAKSKSDAEFRAKAAQNLPVVLDSADEMTGLLDELSKHPGMPGVIGAKGARTGFVGAIVPGTPEAGFKERLDQVGGEAFLQAFERLKGGGQITEIEGQKGTQAIARLGTAQSEKEFLSALDDLKGVINRGVLRARAAAGSNVKGEESSGESIPTGGNLGTNVNQPAQAIKFLGFE